MRHYSGGSLHGSLFSGGATLAGLGDWWDDLTKTSCPDGYVEDSSSPSGCSQASSSTSTSQPTGTPANMKTCADGSVVSMLTPCPDPSTPDVHSPGAVPNIDGCAAEFGYQVDPKNSSYCILTATAQTAAKSCKWNEYYDTFTKKCVQNPELVPAKGEQACPAGTYRPFGSATCIKTPAPKPTGGGGVTKTPTTTTVTPAPPVQQAGIFGLSPFAIGLGLLVAVGGAVYYRRKKKAGGFKKNWHDSDEWADASGWELPAMLAWECPPGYNPNWYGACEPDSASVAQRLLASGAMSPLVGLTPQTSCEPGYALSPVDGQCHADSTQDAPRSTWGGDWRTSLVASPGTSNSLQYILPGGVSLPAPPPGTVYVPQPDGTVATVPLSHLATPPPPGQFIVTQPVCNAWREWDSASGACRVKPIVLVGGAILLAGLAYSFL